MTAISIPVYSVLDGVLERKFRPSISPSFILGSTRPVEASNAGIDPAITLTTYTGPNAGGLLTLTTPNQVISNVDFGTTRIKVRADNVQFWNCKWLNTYTFASAGAATSGGMLDWGNSTPFVGGYLYRCTIDNASQWAPGFPGLFGQGFTAERCVIKNFGDQVDVQAGSNNAGGPLRTALIGTILGPLAWSWAPTSGIAHPSDVKTHNDGMQWQGGTGLRIEGCDISGVYSTTIGTGTPNSGNDTAGLNASAAPSNQADGVAARFSIVDGSGTFSSSHLGGSVSGILFSSTARGNSLDGLVVKNNWGTGGADWCNAGDGSLTGTVTEVSGNRLDNNQRNPLRGLVFYSTVSITNYGTPANTWNDGSGTILRRTS